MASFQSFHLSPSLSFLLQYRPNFNFFFLHEILHYSPRTTIRSIKSLSSRSRSSPSYRFSIDREDDGDSITDDSRFDEAVALFNQRAYYDCHDVLEVLWNRALDPSRTLIHGILQCAVGLHHLFNRNHRGAMMELGEGVCKLRKMEFRDGPFYTFERDISAVLDFVYQTQIELAACDEKVCIRMEGTERSYELLGGYGEGQHLYHLETEAEEDGSSSKMCIVFSHSHSHPLRVKLPTLSASKQHLLALHSY